MPSSLSEHVTKNTAKLDTMIQVHLVLDLHHQPTMPVNYGCGSPKPMCPPFFPALREQLGPFLVDKSKLIANIIDSGLNGVDLVLRPRHCGKSTMLHMLESFFSIPRNDDPEPCLLFAGLDIESRQDICVKHMGKYPVIFCDFQDVKGNSWEEMLSDFRNLASNLYIQWEDFLIPSLKVWERTYFESICNKTAMEDDLTWSLCKLSFFLARKFCRSVIVLIDDYEAPINHAYDCGYFYDANEFFLQGVFFFLLQSNISLQYGVLSGVTPATKPGSGLNRSPMARSASGLDDVETHALHTRNSPFAGMLMFTELEVDQLRMLAKSKLNLADLKAQYNCYLAAGCISVYNPLSVMLAISTSKIENFRVATGEFPLLNKQFSNSGLKVIKVLLTGAEIELDLQEDVTYSSLTLSNDAMLSLLYYAGFLAMTANRQFKIPNMAVMSFMTGWAGAQN